MSSSQEAAERAWRASNAEAAGVELSSGGEGSEGEGAAPSEPGSTGNGNGSHAGAKRRRALKGAAAGTGDGSSAAEIQQVRGECWCWIALFSLVLDSIGGTGAGRVASPRGPLAWWLLGLGTPFPSGRLPGCPVWCRFLSAARG